jgi:integrase
MASLHDGVIKRGRSSSYVIRVTDPLTGVSRRRWVGGHATEAEAKAARDKARQRARRGEYVDRSSITVEEYLDPGVDRGADRPVQRSPRVSGQHVFGCH